MLPAVFVSYSHKDADFARQIVTDISPRIRSVWFDEVSIRPGRYWDDEIEKGIRETDVLLSLLSPNLLGSKICKDEFDNADRLGKPVIPILLTHCDDEKMWMRMARRQWIDFRSDYSNGLNRLLAGLSQLGDYATPLLQKCAICGVQDSNQTSICLNCKSPYLPATLGQIFDFTPDSLQKYLNFFTPRVVPVNAGAADIRALALVHMVLRSFDTATTLLEQLLANKPHDEYAWYLLALSKLKLRRFRLLTRTEAVEIQDNVLKSIKINIIQAQSLLLLALIKFDYFESKGFKIDSPSIAECVERAQRGLVDKSELNALLAFISVPDNKITNMVRRLAY